MSLDEEIALYQFAQGAQSEAALLDRFSQLEKDKKMRRFLDMNSYVRELKPIYADMEQAMTHSSLTDADIADVFPKSKPFRIAIHPKIRFPDVDYGNAYKLLLYLFRIAYQRRFTGYNCQSGRSRDGVPCCCRQISSSPL